MNNEIRIKHATGKVTKTIVGRLLPGTDLITGIEEICKENGIKYGSIETCFGSFYRSGYLYLEPIEGAKLGVGYTDINHVEGPVEFLGATGLICQREGDYEVHIHGTMCDKTGKVFGGHLVKGENPALGTVDLVINEIEGVEILRTYDEYSDSYQTEPRQL